MERSFAASSPAFEVKGAKNVRMKASAWLDVDFDRKFIKCACFQRLSCGGADVEPLYQAFLAAGLPKRGIPRMDPIENKPWGMREIAIVDDDGNLLRVGQEL